MISGDEQWLYNRNICHTWRLLVRSNHLLHIVNTETWIPSANIILKLSNFFEYTDCVFFKYNSQRCYDRNVLLCKFNLFQLLAKIISQDFFLCDVNSKISRLADAQSDIFVAIGARLFRLILLGLESQEKTLDRCRSNLSPSRSSNQKELFISVCI